MSDYCGGRSSEAEEEFRARLENEFGVEFPKEKPKWLICPIKGTQLELDGYNEEHRIAFEYDDPYHFNPGNDLVRLRDAYKDWMCAEKRISLIRVAYNDDESTIKRKIREARNRLTWSNEQWNRRAGYYRSEFNRLYQLKSGALDLQGAPSRS